jgi:hypothetical protein
VRALQFLLSFQQFLIGCKRLHAVEMF